MVVAVHIARVVVIDVVIALAVIFGKFSADISVENTSLMIVIMALATGAVVEFVVSIKIWLLVYCCVLFICDSMWVVRQLLVLSL